MGELIHSLSARELFPHVPTLAFESDIDICPHCSQRLTVSKTRTKTVATLAIGRFRAHEIVRGCKHCEEPTTYGSQALLHLVPHRCSFGYDILVHVGIAAFVDCRTEREIRLDLEQKNVAISAAEIAYLAKKFIVYLALAHRDSTAMLRNFMDRRGGYVLHLDGTCDGDSPRLMTGLDGISELVLENVKLPSEKADKIIPFLRKIKKSYGNPRALVHDMGVAILNAVKEVFPDTPDYICHFHFLRDIGNDLLGKEYGKLRGRLRKQGIQGILRKRAREFKQIIDTHPALVDAFGKRLKKGETQPSRDGRIPVITAYSLVVWALEGKKQGGGYGFPFDQPHLTFYERLIVLYDTLNRLNQTKQRKRDKKPYVKLIRDLHGIMNDTGLAQAASKMREKIVVFDKLREAMRIALPDGHAGLNDDGNVTDTHTIEGEVMNFHHWLSRKTASGKTNDYQNMIDQLEKYWEKLFADPILVDTPQGPVFIQPQRTNNILERFFRDIKRGFRRKKGINTLSTTLKAMLADTPLVKNLQNEDYLRIILDGASSLEERFARIDADMVREELRKSQSHQDFVSSAVKRLINHPLFIQNLNAAAFPH